MENSTKHRWYDAIVAWANGEKIQFNFPQSGWKDYTFSCERISCVPAFNDISLQWRIKPKVVTKKYRMALFSDNNVVAYDVTNSTLDDPIEYKLKGFVGWIGDTAEVEIESAE